MHADFEHVTSGLFFLHILLQVIEVTIITPLIRLYIRTYLYVLMCVQTTCTYCLCTSESLVSTFRTLCPDDVFGTEDMTPGDELETIKTLFLDQQYGQCGARVRHALFYMNVGIKHSLCLCTLCMYVRISLQLQQKPFKTIQI